ncbi:MAG: peptidoglycan-binding protein [Lachnospiraceae bacterium]|nr:peptidoglycan-binding protein [Lachnospiraceae bacterium]
MAQLKVKLQSWLDYLKSRVGIDVYVWGGNGELIVNLLPKLVEMEKSGHTEKEALNNLDRLNTLLQKRLFDKIDIYSIRGEDCSGLGVKFLLDNGIIKGDTNCNGLYSLTKGQPVKFENVEAGDFLFEGNDDNKWHIGYAIDNKYAIECQNHDLGVVKTAIAERKWKYATRPNWYESDKYVLTRILRYTDPLMMGEDVKEVQKRLNELGYNCGTADGIFGRKTDFASRDFKQDAGLRHETGTIGKKTAEKLGFVWEG